MYREMSRKCSGIDQNESKCLPTGSLQSGGRDGRANHIWCRHRLCNTEMSDEGGGDIGGRLEPRAEEGVVR